MHFDSQAKLRTLKSKDLALVLLPTGDNKLLMRWKGPFEIIEPICINDYRIQIGDVTKIFHRKYVERLTCDVGAALS